MTSEQQETEAIVRLMRMSNDELLKEFGSNYYVSTEYCNKVRNELMRRLQFGYHGRMEDLRGQVEHKTLVNADQENKIRHMKVLLWESVKHPQSEGLIERIKAFLMEQE